MAEEFEFRDLSDAVFWGVSLEGATLGLVSGDVTRGDQIVEIPMGFDLFTAQVITESVKAAGFNVRLREMTVDTVALSRVQRHLLMVAAADLEAVRRVGSEGSSDRARRLRMSARQGAN